MTAVAVNSLETEATRNVVLSGMTGVCFDCLAEIDGVPNRQSCMIEVRPEMRISRQMGARVIIPTTG